MKIFGDEARTGGPNIRNDVYHLVMTNIAMENPNHKWRFLAGKIIYKWAIYTMAMLVITRG